MFRLEGGQSGCGIRTFFETCLPAYPRSFPSVTKYVVDKIDSGGERTRKAGKYSTSWRKEWMNGWVNERWLLCLYIPILGYLQVITKAGRDCVSGNFSLRIWNQPFSLSPSLSTYTHIYLPSFLLFFFPPSPSFGDGWLVRSKAKPVWTVVFFFFFLVSFKWELR